MQLMKDREICGAGHRWFDDDTVFFHRECAPTVGIQLGIGFV